MGCVNQREPRKDEALNGKDKSGNPTQANAEAEAAPALKKNESRLRSTAGPSPKKLTPSEVTEKRQNMRKHLEEGNPEPPAVVLPRMQPVTNIDG